MMNNVFNTILKSKIPGERSLILGEDSSNYYNLYKSIELISEVLIRRKCKRYDRVGICLEHGLNYIASLFATRRTDSIGVLYSPDWTISEFSRIQAHSQSRFIISTELDEAKHRYIHKEKIKDLNLNIYEFEIEFEKYSIDPSSAIIIYTSGTTGEPKGVNLSQSGIVENVNAVVNYLELKANDSTPIFTPTCYAYSLSQVLTHTLVGASLFPIKNKLMFPTEILNAISNYNLTGISGTPASFKILLSGKKLSPYNSVRYSMTGGQPLTKKNCERINLIFPKSKIINMYGCTENSPRISYFYVENTYKEYDENYYFPVGEIVSGSKVKISTVGEILISGKSLAIGYWRDDKTTSERFIDGWFHTKDLGYIDKSGYLFISGRMDAMINVGNEKVSPESVEKFINQIEGVEESIVYGVQNIFLGEVVHADVVRIEGYNLKVKNILESCRKSLSSYKIPRLIRFVDNIPKTQYGKIDRKKNIKES